MTPTISKIWNGTIHPIEHLGKYNKEISVLEKLIDINNETLEKQLDKKRIEFFKKYKDCVEEYTFLSCEQAFCDGFCIATKIMAEALSSAEKII